MTTRPAQARAHAQLLRARPKTSRHDVMRAATMLDDLARQLEARRPHGGQLTVLDAPE